MNQKGYGTGGRPQNGRGSSSEGECVAVMGSMTSALQAQKALANAAIFVSVTKISSSGSGRGCAYGVTYPCVQDKNVRTVLARSGLAVKKYDTGDV